MQNTSKGDILGDFQTTTYGGSASPESTKNDQRHKDDTKTDRVKLVWGCISNSEDTEYNTVFYESVLWCTVVL